MLLGARYFARGESCLNLNDVQVSLVADINRKVGAGEYVFEATACAVCGEERGELLSDTDRYGLYLPVVICPMCGLIYTNPRMNQASYASFYDCEYRQLYHGTDKPAETVNAKNRQRGSRIIDFLERSGIDISGKKVLEVGCGAGGILALLRDELGCQIAGCDFGTEAIEFGRIENGLDALHVGDLASFDLPWQPDVIIYCHVLEHILDPTAELARAKSLLPPDGLVYIEVPSVKAIRENCQCDFLRLLQNAHTLHFTTRTLNNLLRRCGFSVVAQNNFTQSVYRIDRDVSSGFESDYADTLRFLRATERLRPWVIGLVTFLGAIGVMPFLKRLRSWRRRLQFGGSK